MQQSLNDLNTNMHGKSLECLLLFSRGPLPREVNCCIDKMRIKLS